MKLEVGMCMKEEKEDLCNNMKKSFKSIVDVFKSILNKKQVSNPCLSRVILIHI